MISALQVGMPTVSTVPASPSALSPCERRDAGSTSEPKRQKIATMGDLKVEKDDQVDFNTLTTWLMANTKDKEVSQ